MKKIYLILSLLSISMITAQATVKTIKHTIKNGETLYTIAHKNHTTIEEVRKANHLKRGATLKIGDVLIVPKNTYFPNKKKRLKVTKKRSSKNIKYTLVRHRIKKGETLYTIAHKNHTTIREVCNVNGLKKDEMLKIGRVLKVPTNTYRGMKPKLAKVVHKNKKIKVSQKESTGQKRLVASLSKLETVPLEKGKAKNENVFSHLSALLFGKPKVPESKSSKITTLAKKKLGRRYVWGATGQKNTFDCSGFTKYIYKKNGIDLPRRAIAQSKYGKYVPREKLQKGDLIFFDTSKHHRGYVNHVGIYLGSGKFIHASSAKRKVVITSLNKKFYAQRYKGARRPL